MGNGILETTDNPKTARIPVDPQQTSLEQNLQFKFFDDCTGSDAIPSGSILIYRFTSVYAAKLQLRLLNGILGGRKYIVYPSIGSESITGGTWEDVSADKISPINNDLSVSELPTHPVSDVTIEKRIATAFSTTAPKRTGTAYKTDGAVNRSSSSYTASGNASGIAAGDSFLLVFYDIAGGATASEFLFQLEWEKRL